MKKINVRLYADSLALPRLSYLNAEQRYIYLLRNFWETSCQYKTSIIDRAKGGSTITEQYSLYKDDNSYFGDKEDVLIIHLGICDCSPRPIPRRVRKVVSALPGFLRNRVIKFLHNNRSFLLRSGSSWLLTEKKKFGEVLKDWLQEAAKNYKRIYIVNIAPTNPAFEKHSPGWMKNIRDYNDVIQEVVSVVNEPPVHLIDIYSNIMNDYSNVDLYIVKEDGHHLTLHAHQVLAEILITLEKEKRKADENF